MTIKTKGSKGKEHLWCNTNSRAKARAKRKASGGDNYKCHPKTWCKSKSKPSKRVLDMIEAGAEGYE